MIVDDDQLTTILRASLDPSTPPEQCFRVVVLEGPDVGASLSLDGGRNRFLVGQSPACELRLRDATVSRRHLAFEWLDGRLRVVDLGSRNGTRVDGLEITGAFLRGGETVAIGGTRLRLEPIASDEIPLETRMRFGRVVGASLEMRRIYALAARLAGAEVSVLIEGETGTGKELVAEAIHESSPRASAPYVIFDCASVSPQLLESELFGHERGAFTGASVTRRGIFEEAHGGTLLLDEIGELPLELQTRLLRALDAREVRRVGSNQWRRVDVRVLGATRRDLDREVQAGRFRDDLYHRLAVTRVELPPLRARKGDVVLLARYFAVQLGYDDTVLPSHVLARWSEASWPGNVRELRNAVARFLALGLEDDDDVLEPLATSASVPPMGPPDDDTGARVAQVVDAAIARGAGFVELRKIVLREFERCFLERTLAAHGGNVVQAAAASGIGRRYFQKIRQRQS